MTAGSGGPGESNEVRPRSFDDYELTLGDIMRGERATLGKSLLDVQRDLKIRAEYVAGIENADLAAFETPGFIRGYVRSYARYLGMNPDWAYARFCDESGFSHVEGLEAQAQVRARKSPARRRDARPHAGDAILARSPISAAPRPGPLHGVQPGAVGSLLVLAVLVAGLGYGGLSFLREVQRVTLAPVEAPLAAPVDMAAAPDIGPAPGDAAPTVAALERLYRPQALDTPVLTPRDRPIAMLDPDAQGVFARPPEPVDTPAPPAAPEATRIAQADTDVTASAPLPQVTEPAPPAVVMFARRPAWVRVRAADGTVIFEKIMEQGERFVLPETEAPATLRAGNSGSVFFAVDGETVGPAGPGTSVAKNVVLSGVALRETYPVADLSGDPELQRIAELATAPATGDRSDE